MSSEVTEIIAKITVMKLAKFKKLGNDDRFAAINAGRAVEMIMEDYQRNVLVQGEEAALQILREDLEDCERAA